MRIVRLMRSQQLHCSWIKRRQRCSARNVNLRFFFLLILCSYCIINLRGIARCHARNEAITVVPFYLDANI